MKRKTKFTLNIGDVFVIPTGDGRAGIGQVVGTNGLSELYFAVFDVVLPLNVAEKDAARHVNEPLQFFGLSFDGKLYAGHWYVVGHAPIGAAVRMPAFKILTVNGYLAEDHDYRRSRPATKEEIERLPYRKSLSPAIFEKALRARLGLQEWHDMYDSVNPARVVPESEVFG